MPGRGFDIPFVIVIDFFRGIRKNGGNEWFLWSFCDRIYAKSDYREYLVNGILCNKLCFSIFVFPTEFTDFVI